MKGSAPTAPPTRPPVPVPADLAEQVRIAIAEDVGSGDLTARLISPDKQGRATVITREEAIVCGIPYVEGTFFALDPMVRFEWFIGEGEAVIADQALFRVSGNARSLLTAERTALNFLQLLSATASATHRCARLLEGTTCTLLDTRKTLPGLRTAQKYAVRVGGGQNHRMGLYDGILIKENHIMAAGSIGAAVKTAKRDAQVAVEVEVENLSELSEAIDAGADMALIDNFSLPMMREAVALNTARGRPLKLEASGGVTEESLQAIAATGVDYVSVGGITKHVRGVDLSMRFEWG
jgi:nicotinate-nucleotide pyrophosphorylase (carboxylating)